MALFKKLISAVKKLFRGSSSSRKRTKVSRRSLKRRRPLKRSSRKIVKKVAVKKSASRKSIAKPPKKVNKPQPKPSKKVLPKVLRKSSVPKAQGPKGVLTGAVTHYFSKIMVCVVKVTHGSFSVGDQVRIQGSGRSFTQKVVSLQIESQDVRVAPKGQLVGLKVVQPVRVGDKVFKL